MNKIIKIALLIFLILLTGCINYTELNNIAIIDSIGISYVDNNYILDVNMISKNDNDKTNYRTTSKSLENAFDKIYTLTSKKTNLSHIELLLLDENLNKENYDNIIKFINNQIDSRNTFNVVMLKNYSKTDINKINALEINNLIDTNNKYDGLVKKKTIDEMISDILNDKESYIPIINIDKEIEILGYERIYTNKIILSKEDSIAYNFITDKINKCNLVTNDLNIIIDSSKTTYKINKNEITFSIFSTIYNYNEDNIKNNYEKLINKYINDYLKNNINSLYFKNLIKKHNYEYYKNNKNKSIKYKIIIKASDTNER